MSINFKQEELIYELVSTLIKKFPEVESWLYHLQELKYRQCSIQANFLRRKLFFHGNLDFFKNFVYCWLW
jgi:hypothetical protein